MKSPKKYTGQKLRKKFYLNKFDEFIKYFELDKNQRVWLCFNGTYEKRIYLKRLPYYHKTNNAMLTFDLLLQESVILTFFIDCTHRGNDPFQIAAVYNPKK